MLKRTCNPISEYLIRGLAARTWLDDGNEHDLVVWRQVTAASS
jgi:hypothetical protein